MQSGSTTLVVRGCYFRRRVGTAPLHGFTLVELLVVITIIGILIALLLPAVQAAREAARRMQCTNNLKQLALAAHNYHAIHNSLPAGSYCPKDGATIYGCHNWFEGLLPFIEQQAVYDKINFKTTTGVGTNLALFTKLWLPGLSCPSDPKAGIIDRSAIFGGRPVVAVSLAESYAPNGGPTTMGLATDCAISAWSDGRNCYNKLGGRLTYDTLGFFAPGDGIAHRFSECTDGLSSTFLFGEQLPAYAVHALYFHSHLTAATVNTPPNYQNVMGWTDPDAVIAMSPNPNGLYGFKSLHADGLNMAMADGSVAFVNETINYRVWVFLGTRNDGESIALP